MINEHSSYADVHVLLEEKEKWNKNSDWNQTDENTSDYIKNRPFYDVVDKKVYIDNQLYSFVDNGSNGYDLTLYETIDWKSNPNQTYTFIIDEVVFKDISCDYYNENYMSFLIKDEEHNITMDIYFFSNYVLMTYFYAVFENFPQYVIHTVEVYQTDEEVKTLDKKLLPDTTKYQADWDEADETSPTYIHNKPTNLGGSGFSYIWYVGYGMTKMDGYDILPDTGNWMSYA